jgi:ApbE superfamily uncharacterized protein (UPF0280 family)
VPTLISDPRLHLHQGPIDLVVEAFADDTAAVDAAYAAARVRFADILTVLVSELPLLRTPLGVEPPPLTGPVALRMLAACWPHRGAFITPMAAVAGSVADEVLAAMVASAGLHRAYVNNGGDIALHLAPGETFRVGLAGIEDAALHGTLDLHAEDAARGVATSGWQGRSLSLGIADSVTVVAADAASADAAATLVANAVNVDHRSIERRPAREVRDDTDLAELPVTVAVGPLPEDAVHEALRHGVARAQGMVERGLIRAACLRLAGEVRIVGIASGALVGSSIVSVHGEPLA